MTTRLGEEEVVMKSGGRGNAVARILCGEEVEQGKESGEEFHDA